MESPTANGIVASVMNDNSTPHVEIYTDGGCEPNPGPGGYGAVLLHPRKRAEASGGFRLITNNRMEIFAAIKNLENFCLSSRGSRPSMGDEHK